jgi:HlyD family secretion protein
MPSSLDRRRLIPVIAAVAAAIGVGIWLWGRSDEVYYTGFVEGEERVLRSEVAGRVLEVAFGEGAPVPADAVVARIDDADVASRIRSKQQELAMLGAQVARQEEEIALIESTWSRDVGAQRAELARADADARLASRTYERQVSLVDSGVSTQQLLDDAHARNDLAKSAVVRAREQLARAKAQEGSIAVARRQLEVLRQQLELSRTQLGELEVLQAKYTIRAPSVATVVQSQLLWPGELAQPGTPVLSVLDPRDKYVQIYVPVGDSARVRVGTRVEIELDSQPGTRVPGEVSFVADQTNFTPEKIETRSDRVGQVYRAKVRILEDVERFTPGSEGNVYLLDGTGEPAVASERGA